MTEPIKVYMAPRISPDSWLNEERFAEFVRGYNYACNATMAIEPLSKLTPEETYWLWSILQHGIEFTTPQSTEPGGSSRDLRP